jgi:hypothetical protein
LAQLKSGDVDQGIDENYILDIFEMTSSTNEPTKSSLITRELLIFKQYQVDVKDIKCPFQWWEKHETMFHIVGFLDHNLGGC